MTISLDAYSRQVYTEQDACTALYVDPKLDISKLDLSEVEHFNRANELLYAGYAMLKLAGTPNCSPEEYHKQNQTHWNMPGEYAEFDISEWCLAQCDTQDQLQRVGQELLMFQDRGLIDMLKFLRYMVAIMRENSIVWGVGRGSSVASYVLYLIGVHKIDSLYFDLDVEDFLR